MKVLMVTQDFWPLPGGIQTYCYELAKALVRQGVELTVLTSGVPDARDGKEGFAVHRIPGFRKLRVIPWAFYIARFATRRKAGRFEFDAVLCAQWQAAFWRLLPGMRHSPRCVTMVHGSELLRSVFHFLTRPLLRAVFSRLDGAAPNSRPVLEMAQARVGRYLPPVQLIHPGVDANRFSPPANESEGQALRERFGLQGKKILLTVTRMVARKNPEVVIQAMPSILEREPNTVYVIVGGGPEKARMQALAAASPARDHILFPGFVGDADLTTWYKICHAFILPSRQTRGDVEGFGIVFLEAGACGKPVIGADTGGIRDAAPHGQCGLLLRDPESIAETAEAVVTILSDHGPGKEMGRFARERILLDLTWEACARHWIEFLAKPAPLEQ